MHACGVLLCVAFIHAQTRYFNIIFYSLQKPSHTCVTLCYIYSEQGNNGADTFCSLHKLSSYEAFYVAQMTGDAYSPSPVMRLQHTSWDMIRWHIYSKYASNLTTAEAKKKPVIHTAVQEVYMETGRRKTPCERHGKKQPDGMEGRQMAMVMYCLQRME